MKRRGALAAGPVRLCAGTMPGGGAERRHCEFALPGATAQVAAETAQAPDPAAAQRPDDSRLPHEPVDDGAHRPAHRGGVRRRLPPESHWSVDASPAMEPSDTGTACHPERRETDRATEIAPMAAE